ncbi:MAG: protein-ADP-ribose hydrolase [Eubacteriales bacterium]|nr:protein-ADP-ribose hydrolase [Eubacteriales bacterium]
MEQKERLDYLLEQFKVDSGQYRDLQVGNTAEEKQAALRSLMNIRMPRYMKEEVLRVQDEYLCERAREKGIVTLDDIETIQKELGSTMRHADKISIWQGDITRLQCGAIVNAANSQMLGCFIPMHTCIDNCIHTFAGIQLRSACNTYMSRMRAVHGADYQEPTGRAMLTDAFNLPAEYVIHTVGPIVSHRLTDRLKQQLKDCYESILACCLENHIRSVAFCCISTGVFHFPNEEAAKIAVKTVTTFLDEHDQEFDRVIFNVFHSLDRKLYQEQLCPAERG